MLTLGLISDTHGLLRPQAVQALSGVDLIIHAGDVGTQDVLSALREIAPLHAVRGNVDRSLWSESLPDTRVVEAGGRLLYVLHDLATLDLDPAAAGFSAVICGHSHQPRVERRGEVLYVNPGSAGPQRFDLPVTVARLQVEESGLTTNLVELKV